MKEVYSGSDDPHKVIFTYLLALFSFAMCDFILAVRFDKVIYTDQKLGLTVMLKNHQGYQRKFLKILVAWKEM